MRIILYRQGERTPAGTGGSERLAAKRPAPVRAVLYTAVMVSAVVSGSK